MLKYLLIVVCILFYGVQNLRAEPIRERQYAIGVSIPLTGHLSYIGGTIRNSIELARERYDEQGQIVFYLEDDAYNPRQTVSAVNKLILNDKVGALITFGGPPSLAVADIAEQRNVPLIGITISDGLTEGREHVYRFFAPVKPQVELIIEEMKRRDYKSIALLTVENDSLISIKSTFKELSSLPVVMNEMLSPADLDHRTLALRVRSRNPSAVFFLGIPPHYSVFARQLREIGYTGDFVGGPPMESRDELEAAGETLEGAWFPATSDTASAEFRKIYKERFSEDPHPHGILAYDAAKILIEGALTGNTKSYLSVERTYSGLFGDYRLGEDRNFLLPVVLKQIKDNEFSLLERE